MIPLPKFLQFSKSRASFATLSLKKAIVLGIAFGILLPGLVVGPLLAVESYRREIDTRVTALQQQYGKMLEQTMVTPVWQADAASAQPFVNAVMLNPDVVSIRVDDAALGKFVHAENPDRRVGTIVQDVRSVMHDGELIGRVTLEMTTAFVEQQFFGNMLKVGAALLMQLLISCLLLLILFEHRLMRPLRQLQHDAQRLSNGALTEPVVILRKDEMGELAQSLDRMREKLGEHIVQISELNSGLEQRVEERTQSLNLANQELLTTMTTLKGAQDEIQRSERLAALGSLVAGVAHELNTPIGICVTVSTTLQDLTKQMSNSMEMGLTRSALTSYVKSTQHASDMLVRNLNNAAELIGSFKQVAVDRTSAQKRRFLLDEVVAETLLTLHPTIKRSEHEVSSDVPSGLQMNSYPGQLGQVLTNLINNAILHGFEDRPQGRIQIVARRLEMDHIELIVSDNGGGIPEANLRRIFDPFFTTKLGRGGSGLGLNIVHNLIVDVLGGSIRVVSEIGQGTSFILNLPLLAPDEPTQFNAKS